MWDIHIPVLDPNNPCKALTYTRKSIKPFIRNITDHPATNPNTVILDINNQDSINFRLFNVYHAVPLRGHGLDRLFNSDIPDDTSTLLIGDFNTHSPRWSLPGKTPSSWATRFTDWMDDNGLDCLNPLHVPTWKSTREDLQPSVIDLALANNHAVFSGQLGSPEISFEDSLGSDHATLTIPIYPLHSVALVPPPQPAGYRAEDDSKEDWMKEFDMLLPSGPPYAPSHCTELHDQESTSSRRSAIAVTVQTSLKAFDDAIQEACHRTLKPKRVLDPKGARWWNDACSMAHTSARSAAAGEEQRAASINLKRTITKAKQDWAHERLHNATDASDIWAAAAHRKGRRTSLFPPLCDASGSAVDKPDGKALVFKDKFFPGVAPIVNPHHPSDPPPRAARTWTKITPDNVSRALRSTSNKSAPGPSGMGYKLLKWAHTARPEYLPTLYNRCLDMGLHPWKCATVVMVNKPQKLDYSISKAYRPIALMECAGKLLEKIVAKRINANIKAHNLLPMTQFGSRPHHNAVDAVACLIHKIQGTIATGHAGALLLFDISGFFDNVNPVRAVSILCNKGFPPTVCDWTLSFLTGREASI
jgi:hypothetical protein